MSFFAYTFLIVAVIAQTNSTDNLPAPPTVPGALNSTAPASTDTPKQIISSDGRRPTNPQATAPGFGDPYSSTSSKVVGGLTCAMGVVVGMLLY
jgi:hypothetical protein